MIKIGIRNSGLARWFGLGATAVLLAACIQDPGDEEDGRGDETVDKARSAAVAFPVPNLDIQTVNLDGNALVDQIFRSQSNTFSVRLNGSGVAVFWLQHGGPYVSKDQAKYADVNGDGKQDLIFQGTDNRFWVSRSTGTSFTPPQNWVSHGGPYVPGQATYSDLNGDRKADLTFRGVDGRYWVSFSTGTWFTPPRLR